MAAAEEQQQPQKACSGDENAAHAANQVSSKSVQNSQINGVDKVESELHSGENKENTPTQTATTLDISAFEWMEKQHRSELPTTVNGNAAAKNEKDTDNRAPDPSDVPHPMDVDDNKHERETGTVNNSETLVQAASGALKLAESKEMSMDSGAVSIGEQSDGKSDGKTDVAMETVVMDVDGGDEAANGAHSVETEVDKDDTEPKSDAVAHKVEATVAAEYEQVQLSVDTAEDSEMSTEDVSLTNEDQFGLNYSPGLIDAEVTQTVNDLVTSLAENVFLAETVKIATSPLMPHLSADEAMELLDFHQGDDHELLPEHDTGTDADIEPDLTDHREYQWFDGDDDDDGAAIEAPTVLDVTSDTTDDVFGFNGVDLTDLPPRIDNNADINSDGSGDTVVIPDKSNSSSSSSSSSGSSSSSSSSSSSVSSSDDEQVRVLSNKRHAAASSGPRKLRKYKKQKREAENQPQKRFNRKRKIPQPHIPPEFRVFETDAADPILKGLYSIRNNRRACFVGNWGFSDEAFQNLDSVSPFEYTSRTRVLQSRRKDDKRPVSGKYAGFFKLRQFDGKLVKIREDQVELQFLPMPASDAEEDEEMEEYDSEENGEDPVPSRYTVLGKGKNRFGRFLIRGYLNPEDGKLVVKRRYLE
ncbi:uncharacterized protein PITG_12742 [Phytophthora infestans T30-4]|uniref:Uncharacterized protein n=1 Tax=Phytophthora infestans (strain T30-4) TaxID=403677 RepID=D0NL18_PHYIT|nr:uncharacterized protein PITG_12742 [Phytophthora infestans T30-4]EEY60336.1 conserved hypothetical protein [Phytophthora infestans T30-4]|eukprot:XP_002900132.1 conserved hypothetical protein [Phytophthora infestans T30-4]